MRKPYLKGLWKKHGSKMVAALSIGGVGLTAYTSWNAALKYNDIKEEYDLWEKAKILAPPIISGVATTGLIVANEICHNKRTNELVGVISAITAAKSINKSLVEQYDRSIDSCALYDKNYDDLVLFYEDYFGNSFEKTPREVFEAEKKLNEKLLKTHHVSLNDFYIFLGEYTTEMGDIVGWSTDYLMKQYGARTIEFAHRIWKIDDGPEEVMECNAIITVTEPTPLWY